MPPPGLPVAAKPPSLPAAFPAPGPASLGGTPGAWACDRLLGPEAVPYQDWECSGSTPAGERTWRCMENRSTPLRSREWTCSGHPDQGDGTSTWKRGNCYSTVCFTVQASNRPDTWITCGRHSTNDPAVIEATCGWGDPDAPERIVWRLSDGVATATGDAGFGPASWTCIGSPGVNRHRCEGTIGDPIFTSGVPVVFGTHF